MVDSTKEPSGSATTRPRKAASRPAGPPAPVDDKPAKKAAAVAPLFQAPEADAAPAKRTRKKAVAAEPEAPSVTAEPQSGPAEQAEEEKPGTPRRGWWQRTFGE